MTPPSVSSARLVVEDGVAHLELVPVGNASRQGPAFWREMPELFAWIDEEPSVRCVLVTGGGKGFSHGLDLAAMAGELAELVDPSAGARGRTRLLATIKRMQAATNAFARSPKPVLAAIHGACIGAGVDIASACDIRLCSADARFSVREVKLAIVADVGSLARLPPIVGEGVTRELALTGDEVDAARALSIGLVSRVFPTAPELFAEAKAMASRIAANSPLVTSGIKRVLNLRAEREAERSLDDVALWNAAFLPSKDVIEAMSAFMQKRAPRFSGE